MTASLRQRDMKLLKLEEDCDENGWHAQTVSPPTTMYLAGSLSPARLLADELLKREDGLAMADDVEMSSMQQRNRCFGGEHAVGDAYTPHANSEGSSSFLEVSARRPPHHDALRSVDSVMKCYVGTTPVSVKTECSDVVGLTSPSSSALPVSAADKLLSVSWQGGKQMQVLSGGYCCEVDSNVAAGMSAVQPFISDDFSRSPPYIMNTCVSRVVEMAPADKYDPMSVDENADCTATQADTVGVAPVTCSMRATVASPDDGVSAAVKAERRSQDAMQTVDVSPGSKWHMASDRDSPYVSVMALASSCHLFSESCPSKSASGDDGSLAYDPASSRYWLEPELPDENVIFTEKHCEMINQITAAYDRYVQTGTIINETLVSEMKVNFTETSVL